MTQAPRDPGLQPERTRLAWRRTTLSCTVAAVLAARQALHGGEASAVGVLGAGLSLLVWIAFLAVAHRRIGELDRGRPRALGIGAGWAAVGCTLALAGFAVAVVV
ncbi:MULTISPECIES: DUF202 domain-containing protein [Streptomyces]|uniref:DUF202 domain-containing protein n=2 Tax=Streptomyces TaxID=1883 RepID=A0A124EBZ6_9ACTN|nr:MULTISPECIES: DUF202 domain-containing protein [Streptomyces]KUH36036.1 hypothetical protein ATE80_25805 [Streptomyces kanasensis]UUS30298.1 DUF202 domain-containing protein [Streptomyces changanensis]